MLLALFPTVRAPGSTCTAGLGLSDLEQACRTADRKPSNRPTASYNRTAIQQPLSTTAHRWRALCPWITLAPGPAPKWASCPTPVQSNTPYPGRPSLLGWRGWRPSLFRGQLSLLETPESTLFRTPINAETWDLRQNIGISCILSSQCW